MTGTVHVNPWRFRGWSPRGLVLGGMANRTLADGPLLEAFRTHNAPVDRDVVAAAGLDWLERERFLVPEPVPLDHVYAPELGFLSYWPGSPLDRLERLRQASVGVVGVGGLGSQVAHLLAAAGVGTLVLCDRDVVEESNLNRQLYDCTEVGRPKVEASAERLRRLRPGIRVETLQRTVSTAPEVEDAVRGVDLVVRAIDTPLMAPFEVDLACRRMGVPHIGGGFLETWAVAGPFIAAGGPCLRCLSTPPDIEIPPGARRVPTFAPLTFWLSAQVGGDALRHLAGLGQPWTLERTVMLDWRSGEVREEAYRVRPGPCPACGAINGGEGDASRRAGGPDVDRVRGGGGDRAPAADPARGTAGVAAGGGDRGPGRAGAAPAAGWLTGAPPALVGACAVLSGLALLGAPAGVRLGVVLAGALLTGALGALAHRPRSVRGGYLWSAAWGFGATLVGALQLVLTSPAIMARPLTGVAALLVGLPIDTLLLSSLGLAGAWVAARARRPAPAAATPTSVRPGNATA